MALNPEKLDLAFGRIFGALGELQGLLKEGALPERIAADDDVPPLDQSVQSDSQRQRSSVPVGPDSLDTAFNGISAALLGLQVLLKESGQQTTATTKDDDGPEVYPDEDASPQSDGLRDEVEYHRKIVKDICERLNTPKLLTVDAWKSKEAFLESFLGLYRQRGDIPHHYRLKIRTDVKEFSVDSEDDILEQKLVERGRFAYMPGSIFSYLIGHLDLCSLQFWLCKGGETLPVAVPKNFDGSSQLAKAITSPLNLQNAALGCQISQNMLSPQGLRFNKLWRLEDFLIKCSIRGYGELVKWLDPISNMARKESPQSGVSCWDAKHLSLVFFVRYLSPSTMNGGRNNKLYIGVPFERSTATIVDGDGAHRYMEHRSCVLFMTWKGHGHPLQLYSVVTLSDGVNRQRKDMLWKKLRPHMRPCGRFAGLTHFLAMALYEIEKWELQWENTLQDLSERIGGLKVDDFRDEKAIHDLMYGGESLSKKYFTLIQLLFLTESWIQDTCGDFKTLQANLFDRMQDDETGSEEYLQNLEHNFDIVGGMIERKASSLIQQARRMSEEIKSLRDGLINAMSLREATKGMALNRAIYVFTVVTVIYTPISFLAGFWAMPYWESDSSTETEERGGMPRGFFQTWIIIPILTYVFSALVAGYLGSSRSAAYARSLADKLSPLKDWAEGKANAIRSRRRRNAVEDEETADESR